MFGWLRHSDVFFSVVGDWSETQEEGMVAKANAAECDHSMNIMTGEAIGSRRSRRLDKSLFVVGIQVKQIIHYIWDGNTETAWTSDCAESLISNDMRATGRSKPSDYGGGN